jgi:hypothetical protein
VLCKSRDDSFDEWRLAGKTERAEELSKGLNRIASRKVKEVYESTQKFLVVTFRDVLSENLL